MLTSTPSQHNTKRPASYQRQILLSLIFLVALYAIVPHLGNFRASWSVVTAARLSFVGLAVASLLVAYLLAALTYYLLTPKPLPYWRTVAVQMAGTFVSRLLPAGIGGIGTNYAYLHKQGQKPGQAGSIVAVNNLLGAVGHGLLILVLFGLFHDNLPAMSHLKQHAFVWPLVVTVVIILGLLLYVLRRKLRTQLRQIKRQLQFYATHPTRLGLALISSMLLTTFTVCCLWFCSWALHEQLSFLVILIIFSFGLAIGTAVPTPGGLGGTEVALVAGFVAYHVSGATALAIVLLYRLLSYWLTLLIGGLAFIVVQRRNYL